jgi:DNA transposition AAA+ family ATPase
MRADTFIETSQVAALRVAVAEALAAGPGRPSMVMAYGDAGTGKTWAGRKLYVDMGGYYMRALEGATQNAFLQDLCFEITGTRPFRSADCKRAIIRKLEAEPAVVFLDEIDRAQIGRFEDLRDISDLTNAPMVFMGEMGLPSRVAARERINDRIPDTFRVHFGPISGKDVMLFALEAADLELTPEAASVIHASTKGIFRRVDNAVRSLDKAAKATRIKEIKGDMARQILKVTGV